MINTVLNVFKHFERFLNSRSNLFIEVTAYAALLLVGYLTMREQTFAVLYFFPTIYYAWHGSGRLTRNVIFSLVATLTWLAADLRAGYQHIQPVGPYWNAVIRLGVFVTVFILFHMLREDRAKLAERNAQLEHLSDLKNQFFGMAAHDLRGPITVILLYTEMLLTRVDENLSGQQKEFLKRILDGSNRMLDLLDDLLDISKIESGKFHLELTEEDYGSFVRETVDSLGILAEAKEVSLDVYVEEDLQPIRLDTGRMEQVLGNLVGNAIKFSPTGTSVEVRVERDDHRVVTRVTDQGRGISARELPGLFQPFNTADTQATGGERKTGLGLTIAKKIVEGHGGQIGVESRVGQGATFFFKLPAGPPSGGGPGRQDNV